MPTAVAVGQTFQSAESSDDAIVIYYPLNDSHSHDWVQKNPEGVIGISYFQRTSGSYDEGVLIYKTINPDESVDLDTVMSGTRLEKSVFLYDSLSRPHIFLARSDTTDQTIDHFYLNDSSQWQSETIIHFNNEGGKFIYELSADVGPDGAPHLLILKARSNIDSEDFMDAWIDSWLYHMTFANGVWETEPIHHYDMAYTYDMYVKSSCRQDIKIDRDGFVHVTFSEQLQGSDDPSRLLYANNRAGYYQIEVALSYDPGSRDDAGWYPSLCLDTADIPYISCMYVDRVYTYSATYCHLLLLKRLGRNNWETEVVATHDDGYYGSDGRDYTGALTHLVFDSGNTPHIIFSDIASTHYPAPVNQCLTVGNIRYGVCEEGVWDFTTLYRQPRQTDFLHATEMYDMCLLLSDNADSIRVIGQELEIYGEYQYTSRFVDVEWSVTPTPVEDDSKDLLPRDLVLSQNYPNPFNPGTSISFELSRQSPVIITVFNLLGQPVRTVVDREFTAGRHIVYWDGKDHTGNEVSTGTYFYRLRSGDYVESKKMMLVK